NNNNNNNNNNNGNSNQNNGPSFSFSVGEELSSSHKRQGNDTGNSPGIKDAVAKLIISNSHCKLILCKVSEVQRTKVKLYDIVVIMLKSKDTLYDVLKKIAKKCLPACLIVVVHKHATRGAKFRNKAMSLGANVVTNDQQTLADILDIVACQGKHLSDKAKQKQQKRKQSQDDRRRHNRRRRIGQKQHKKGHYAEEEEEEEEEEEDKEDGPGPGGNSHKEEEEGTGGSEGGGGGGGRGRGGRNATRRNEEDEEGKHRGYNDDEEKEDDENNERQRQEQEEREENAEENAHEERDEIAETEDTDDDAAAIEDYTCGYCGMNHLSKHDVFQHMPLYHSGLTPEQRCAPNERANLANGHVHVNNGKIERHNAHKSDGGANVAGLTNVPVSGAVPAPVPLHQCPVCRATFSNKKELFLHIKNDWHNGSKKDAENGGNDEFDLDIPTQSHVHVVIRRPTDNHYLLVQVVGEKDQYEFDLPNGPVLFGQTLLEAIEHYILAQTGITAHLKGVIEFRHNINRLTKDDVHNGSNQFHVFFFAEHSKTVLCHTFFFYLKKLVYVFFFFFLMLFIQKKKTPYVKDLPKSIPTYDSAGAAWMSIQELTCVRLRNSEICKWCEELSMGHGVYPLSILKCLKHDPRSAVSQPSQKVVGFAKDTKLLASSEKEKESALKQKHSLDQQDDVAAQAKDVRATAVHSKSMSHIARRQNFITSYEEKNYLSDTDQSDPVPSKRKHSK
ncbi:hypothetical protein RFI_14965, partial [Reticulomyxa filosa]